MPSLVFASADGQRTELPLKAGVNRIGRVEGNDILVPDGSVSKQHCEVTVEGDRVMVRDLGAANGTAVNGALVQEAALLPGEVLRVGNIEFTLNGSGGATPPVQTDPPPGLIPGEACRNHPKLPAKWRCTKCGELACDTCVVDGRALGVPGVKVCRSCKSQAVKMGAAGAGAHKSTEGKTFVGEMSGAWKYPFRGDGLIIMLTGTVFFALADYAQGVMFLIGGLIYVMTTGYWMAYAQKVVSTSAQGDDEPPTWPDLSDFVHDILGPFFQAAGLFILYLLPVWLAAMFLPGGAMKYGVVAGLLLIALFMMPMAWLAISMHESIVGLSPHFVIPSILRIPGHYMLVFVELVVLVAINVGLEMVLERLAIPIVGALVSSLLSVYFMLVICRLLGSLYFLNRNRLRWF